MQKQPSFNFSQLTPDIILDSLYDKGVIVDSGLTELNSFENRVYQFSDRDEKKWVVKYYRPERWHREQILEELAFADELAQDNVSVIAPQQVKGEFLFDYQGYLFSLFPYVPARAYEIDNIDNLYAVGQQLGHLHNVGERKVFRHRRAFDLTAYVYQPCDTLRENAMIPKKIAHDLDKILHKLVKAIERTWHTDWDSCRIHGDCHPGNILWREGPLFVDFDDAANGPAVQDLWMLLHGEDKDKFIQLDMLLEGYEENRRFNSAELSLIEPLRTMRMIHYLAWVVNRWCDPAFPKSFPWIMELSFWEKQLQSFNEQLNLLQAPPKSVMPVY